MRNFVQKYRLCQTKRPVIVDFEQNFGRFVALCLVHDVLWCYPLSCYGYG